jgi:hypothetical protein
MKTGWFSDKRMSNTLKYVFLSGKLVVASDRASEQFNSHAFALSVVCA